MTELNKVAIFDGEVSPVTISGWGRRYNNPVVVGVIVRVAGDLLA